MGIFAIFATLWIVAVPISGGTVPGQQVTATVITECTDENIVSCIGPFLQIGFDPTDVILSYAQALDFCARFNQSLRCVHDLIAVCEDQTRARRGEYNLYYRLCQGNFDVYLIYESCFGTSPTIEAELKDCVNVFNGSLQQDPNNTCRYAQQYGLCAFNSTLQHCGIDAAEWVIAVLASMLIPTIPRDECLVWPPSFGSDCGSQVCLHGWCYSGDICVCTEDWTGSACETRLYPYQCTAVDIQACLKGVSGLYWNATIAPVFDDNEFADFCRAYLVTKRCLAHLQSDCYLLQRLRLSAFQYVADYICSNMNEGYLLHKPCFDDTTLVAETSTCYDIFLGSIIDDPMNLTNYYTNACTPLDTYIACIRVAMDSSGSCSEQAIAWQTELSRRILWVEYGMPNIPCWGNNFSEIIGTDDIYGLFDLLDEVRGSILGCSESVVPDGPISDEQDYCSELSADWLTDDLPPSCVAELRFHQQLYCIEVPPATIKYDIALNYTDALSHVTSQERVQLENSLCTSWATLLQQLNATLQHCELTHVELITVGSVQSTLVIINLYAPGHVAVYIDRLRPCGLLGLHGDVFDHPLAGSCFYSDNENEECGFNYDKIVLSLARGLQGSARSSQDTVDFDERGSMQRVLNATRIILQTTCEALVVPFYYEYLKITLCATSSDTACSNLLSTTTTTAPTDACANNPCGMHGTCVLNGNDFSCACGPNYIGVTCRELSCGKGYEAMAQTTCVPCARGFYKEDIDVHLCTACPVGTTTTNTGSSSASDCQPEMQDACANDPCGMNGACSLSGDDFVCACDSGYYGDTCSNRDYAYETSINIGNEVHNIELEVKESVDMDGERPVTTRQIKWKKRRPII